MESAIEDNLGMTPQQMELAKMLGNEKEVVENLEKDTRHGFKQYGRKDVEKTGGFAAAALAPLIPVVAPIIGKAITGIVNWVRHKIAKRHGAGKTKLGSFDKLISGDKRISEAEKQLAGMSGPEFWGHLRAQTQKHGGRIVSQVMGVSRAAADSALRPMLQRMLPRGLAKPGRGVNPTGGSVDSSEGGQFINRARPIVHFILYKFRVPTKIHEVADKWLDERAAMYNGRGLYRTGGNTDFFVKTRNVVNKAIENLIPHIGKSVSAFKGMTGEQSARLINKIISLVPDKKLEGITKAVKTPKKAAGRSGRASRAKSPEPESEERELSEEEMEHKKKAIRGRGPRIILI
jgi:hypothetical protein